MTPRSAAVRGALIFGLVALACADDGAVASDDDDSQGGGVTTSTTATAVGAGGGGGSAACEPQPLPDFVPPDWEERSDYACGCRFYVPGARGTLPDPISWEPCVGAPEGVECQFMTTDWSDADWLIALHAKADVDVNGEAVLFYVKVLPTMEQYVIANVDGPTRNALIFPYFDLKFNELGCYSQGQFINEGQFVISFRGENLFDEHDPKDLQGAIGGAIDDRSPPLLLKDDADTWLSHSWRGGGNWLLHSVDFELRARRWDQTPADSVLVHRPDIDPEGLKALQRVTSGDAVFFKTSSGTKKGVNVWTPADGFRPFLRWVGDPTRAAGNLGTDGVDMVWSYGEGEPYLYEDTTDPYLTWPERSIMTAPFTTDPDAVEPRRLRSSPSPALANQVWEVGCGYAVGRGGTLEQLLVRLSDGWSWTIPINESAGGTVPIAVTCEEVFMQGHYSGKLTIGRYRIDSLGPGMPPD